LNPDAKIGIELIIDKATRQPLDVYSRVLNNRLIYKIKNENEKIKTKD